MTHRTTRPQKALKDAVPWIVLLLFFGGAFGFLFHQRHALIRLPNFDLSFFTLLFLSACLWILFLGIAQTILFRRCAPTLHWYQGVQMALAGNLLNYLPGRGGLIGRAIYLHMTHAVSWQTFATATVRGQMVILFLSATVGVLAGIYLATCGLAQQKLVIPITLMLAIVAVIAACAYYWFALTLRIVKNLPIIRERFSERLQSTEQNGLDARNLPTYSAFSLLAFSFVAFRLWLAFYTVGHPLPPTIPLLMQSVVAAGLFLSLLPGNLGLRESIIVALAVPADVPLDMAVSAALLDRFAAMAVVFTFGPWAAKQMSADAVRAKRAITD